VKGNRVLGPTCGSDKGTDDPSRYRLLETSCGGYYSRDV